MNRIEFDKEIKWFCEYYSDFVMGKTMILVWVELLKNYTSEQLHKALLHHIKSDEQPFFPAFGKINQQLIKIVRTIQ